MSRSSLLWSAEAEPPESSCRSGYSESWRTPADTPNRLSCLISHTQPVCPRANTANSLWGSVTTRTRPNSTQLTHAERGMVGGIKKIRCWECLDCAGHRAQHSATPKRWSSNAQHSTRSARSARIRELWSLTNLAVLGETGDDPIRRPGYTSGHGPTRRVRYCTTGLLPRASAALPR